MVMTTVVCVLPPELEAVMVYVLATCTVEGVPLIVQVLLKDSPEGRLGLAEQVEIELE